MDDMAGKKTSHATKKVGILEQLAYKNHHYCTQTSHIVVAFISAWSYGFECFI